MIAIVIATVAWVFGWVSADWFYTRRGKRRAETGAAAVPRIVNVLFYTGVRKSLPNSTFWCNTEVGGRMYSIRLEFVEPLRFGDWALARLHFIDTPDLEGVRQLDLLEGPKCVGAIRFETQFVGNTMVLL